MAKHKHRHWKDKPVGFVQKKHEPKGKGNRNSKSGDDDMTGMGDDWDYYRSGAYQGAGTGAGRAATYTTTYKNEFLTPHTPQTKIVFTGDLPNKIKVKPVALEKMHNYIQLCPEEIGWLGTVNVVNDTYVIEDVLLFKQEVTAATTEIDENSLAQIVNDILVNNPEHGMAIANSLRFWGHSHVNMGVNPSGQDDAQMRVFNTQGVDYFIRGIGNKAGNLRFDIYHYTKGIAYMDVEWTVVQSTDTAMKEAIKTEILEKVVKRSFTYAGYTGAGASTFPVARHGTTPATTGALYSAGTGVDADPSHDAQYYMKQLTELREKRRQLIANANGGTLAAAKDEYAYGGEY